MADERDETEADLDGFPVSSGADPDHGRDDLERLASTLAERLRKGAAWDAGEVAAERPDLAARLREVAPVIEALERWKTLKGAECGAGDLPATLPVQRLGDCRLGREIGRGGNAVVFEAVQGTAWRRHVAVKVLPWRVATDGGEGRTRFLEEAATLARVQHRHIVPIYSYGSESGYSYCVMQLAEGGSLDRLIAQLRAAASTGEFPQGPAFGRSDWRRFAELGTQVAEGLHWAHSKGVVHGDVKPANVLLDAAGSALVADFGPAVRCATEGGRLAGTYRYMAPERFDGVCDERSDVYSLGATLYELVTLTPAFEEEGRQSLEESITRHRLIAPRLLRPDLPPDLDAVIVKAMARDPEARYRTAGTLAADLRNFMRGRPVSARRPDQTRPLYRRWFGGPKETDA